MHLPTKPTINSGASTMKKHCVLPGIIISVQGKGKKTRISKVRGHHHPRRFIDSKLKQAGKARIASSSTPAAVLWLF